MTRAEPERRSTDGTTAVERGVIEWLLEGDSAVRFQTRRDLLDQEDPRLQQQIPHDGDAAIILDARGPDGHWGRGFYQPKWTSSHYSLLELRDLGVPRDHWPCVQTVALVSRQKSRDGGVSPSGPVKPSDACINGMFLAYAAHFTAGAADLESVVDFVLGQQMGDGGFNCQSNRSGATTASVHTTTSVIDGLAEYLHRGHTHRSDDVSAALQGATENLLDRHLYQRHRDQEPIRDTFTRFHQPARWYFDVLRGLDVLRAAQTVWDPRLEDAMRLVEQRRAADGRWAAASQYPGQTHLAYPRAGAPNRWVTLRALRVLRYWAEARQSA